jgi:hypothetical protein
MGSRLYLVLRLLQLPLLFGFKMPDILRKLLNCVICLLDRCATASLLFPPFDLVLLFSNRPLLRIDFFANFTLLRDELRAHHQFHAACLTCSVFFGAMLTKVSPLEAGAGHFLLVVKTHFGRVWFATSYIRLVRQGHV